MTQSLRADPVTVASPLVAPVFILGSHKSGSSLLRSLLDGHPSLFVVPAETHFFQRAGYWVDYRLRRAWPRTLDRDGMVRSLVRGVERKNEGSGRLYGDGDLSGQIDVAAFSAALERGTFTSPRLAFESYMHGLHAALVGGAIPPDRRLVEKSVEHAEYAGVLRQMFPDCRFIHIVRNPYASLVAIRKSRKAPGFPDLSKAVLSLQNSYYNLYRNEQSLDRYHVITYEQLVSDARGVMTAVAQSLGIPFDDILLQPTLFGAPWSGNSSSGRSFSGVTAGPLSKWTEDITDLEVALVNAAVSPVLERFGYERRTPARRLGWPVSGERPMAYARNRALLWFL